MRAKTLKRRVFSSGQYSPLSPGRRLKVVGNSRKSSAGIRLLVDFRSPPDPGMEIENRGGFEHHPADLARDYSLLP
jgi:hypothetical protein